MAEYCQDLFFCVFIVIVAIYKLDFFSGGTQRVIPSGLDSTILPPRVANDRAGFDSPCSMMGI